MCSSGFSSPTLSGLVCMAHSISFLVCLLWAALRSAPLSLPAVQLGRGAASRRRRRSWSVVRTRLAPPRPHCARCLQSQRGGADFGHTRSASSGHAVHICAAARPRDSCMCHWGGRLLRCVSTTVSTTVEQRMNELAVKQSRTTPTGRFNIAERHALALTLIDMTGFADLSTSRRVILPGFGAHQRHEQGQRSTVL
jgi:hypothetical protein